MTSATFSKAGRKWRFSSHCWPIVTKRRSILLTSNLIFSDWERIFKDPLTTAAAIDRLVHHSVILELNVPSYRMESAKAKQQGTTK